jgi:hypothetical protein
MGKLIRLSAILTGALMATVLAYPLDVSAANPPFLNPRVLIINPFMNRSVLISPNQRVASFNPFIRVNQRPFFPNAQVVFNPAFVAPTAFGGDITSQARVVNGLPLHNFGHNFASMYGMNGMNGYGSGSSGYGNSSYYNISKPTYYQVQMPAQPSEESLPIFDLLGLPNTGGRLDWALGLKVLPPALETQALRQQIEAELLAAGYQALGGSLNREVLQKIHDQVERLRKLLNENETKFAQTTAVQARQFLDKLEAAPKTLEQLSSAYAASQPAGSYRPPQQPVRSSAPVRSY